jgi:hypothetical protein
VIGQRPKPRARIGIVNQPLVNTAAGYAFDVQEILLASHGPNVKNPHESTGAVALVVSSDFGTAGYETDTKTAIARLNVLYELVITRFKDQQGNLLMGKDHR